MSLAKVTQVAGTAVYVPGSDIDTDRIIPARFMKCVTFDGLGEFAFYDVRKNADGTDREHPLNDERFKGANILLSGSNFGCGSSREHAPQALYRFGFRAVIAESFAEIFFGNCTTLGIPCAVASGQDIRMLAKEVERNPKLEVTVDLVAEKVLFEDQEFAIVVPHTAREALTTGQWDPIAELLKHKDAVADKVRELSLA
ncbi:3-isopropylmalate dehydratase small subunit [Roseimicrobium gellanilyticum]|uniref:3-isopropylmalate dehydratase n=1 Tax=Roseimicrobium gellanilyticum TaxID=748857 RepID=A0A366HLF8_9BACT|nr:3-isopropylmalate dehydratase small subunit [Roseimicrobium gellanilyticum]RBP43763.1 3-isopropylmalate dehydratase small subunit [Roseimicrobium gellanilyticum]